MSINYSEEQEYLFYIIDIVNDVLTIFISISYSMAYAIILSYLNNVSLAKDCILLKMYKDVMSSSLWNSCFWMMKQLVRYWNEEETSKILAMIISFAIWFGYLYMFLIITFICMYKFYMAKNKVLDPSIPMIGEDEESAVTRIRMTFGLVSLGFLSTTFGIGLYPKLFYTMIPNQTFRQDTKLSFHVYRSSLLLLLVVAVSFSVAKMFYKEESLTQLDRMIPKATKCITIATLVSLGALTIIDAVGFENEKLISDISHLILSLMKIIAPCALILRFKQLREHSIKFLRDQYDNAFFFSIYLVPSCVFILLNTALYILF